MIWKITKKNIVLVTLIGTVLVVYQNCSRVTSFQEAPSTQSDLGLPNLPVPATIETKSFSKNIGAAQPLNNQIDIVLLVDDSKSNAVYANQIVQGIKDLFTRLTTPNDFAVSITAYSMGYQGAVAKSTSVINNLGGRIDPIDSKTYLRISQYSRGNPIAAIKVSSQKTRTEIETEMNAGLLAIQNHLTLATTQISPDTTPHPFCDLVALLSDNKNTSVKKSTVFIMITDEDADKNGVNSTCTKHWDILYSKGSGGSPYVIVKGSKTVNAEGGGSTQINDDVQLRSISSCSEISSIRSSLVSMGYNSEFTNCQVYQNSEGTDRQIDVTYYSYLGEGITSTAQAQNPNFLKVNPQMMRTFELPMQGPVFIGLFAIQKPTDIKNADQELGTNLSSWIPSILPAGQFQLQSLTNPNYSSFIDQVMNFKANADNNSVSISELIGQIPNGKSLKISEVFFNEIKVQSFSRQGNSIIVNDSTIKINDGGSLRVLYTIE